MSALEKIVRPAQSETITPPRRLPDTRQGTVGPVVLRIGRTGSGKSFNASYSSTVTVYMDAHQNERRF